MKEVVFPSTVETILKNAFSNNVELKQVDLSKCRIGRLDDYVFEDCCTLEVFCYYAGELEDLEFHKVVLNGAYDTEGTTSKVCAAQITIGEKLTFEDLLQEYNRLHEND